MGAGDRGCRVLRTITATTISNLPPQPQPPPCRHLTGKMAAEEEEVMSQLPGWHEYVAQGSNRPGRPRRSKEAAAGGVEGEEGSAAAAAAAAGSPTEESSAAVAAVEGDPAAVVTAPTTAEVVQAPDAPTSELSV